MELLQTRNNLYTHALLCSSEYKTFMNISRLDSKWLYILSEKKRTRILEGVKTPSEN